MQALVLGRGVVVAGAGTGNEFDFVAHGRILRRLNALTAGTQVRKDLFDAVLVDDAKSLVRNAQAHETLLGFDPEALVLQVRQKATTGPVIGMGNVVAALRPLPSHLANPRHCVKSLILLKVARDRRAESATLYQSRCRYTRRPAQTAGRRASQQPAPGQRGCLAVADDQVVQQPDIDQIERRFQPCRDAFIGLAGFGDARWVIVGEDDRGGVDRKGLLDDLAGIDRSTVDRATKQLVEPEDSVAIVEIQAAKSLMIEMLQAGLQKRLGIRGTANRLSARQRLGEIATSEFRQRAQRAKPGVANTTTGENFAAARRATAHANCRNDAAGNWRPCRQTWLATRRQMSR